MDNKRWVFSRWFLSQFNILMQELTRNFTLSSVSLVKCRTAFTVLSLLLPVINFSWWKYQDISVTKFNYFLTSVLIVGTAHCERFFLFFQFKPVVSCLLVFATSFSKPWNTGDTPAATVSVIQTFCWEWKGREKTLKQQRIHHFLQILLGVTVVFLDIINFWWF